MLEVIADDYATQLQVADYRYDAANTLTDVQGRALTAEDFIKVHTEPLYVKTVEETYMDRYPNGVPFREEYEQQIHTHKAVVDDEGNILSIVGKGYNVIQNADIIPDYERAIYLSGLDTTGMTRDIQQSHGGARTVVTYTFPAHRIEVRKDDPMDLKISVLNSYDGSWKFMSLVGALRLACLNGQVIGNFFSSFYGKHTKSLEPEVAVNKLRMSLGTYTENAEYWKQYPNIPVNELQVNNVFINLAGESKVLGEYLHNIYAKYQDDMGANLWALYNTLTDWSSHAEFRNKANQAATVITREQKVRKVLPMLENIRLAA
tara:strand:+ start:4600 stop:5553 length:954 start_codon:yes stop_codon:yes gene_type:complete